MRYGKKIAKLFVTFFVAFLILDLISITMRHFQLLEPTSLSKLKEGKTFWTWQRRHNTYDVHYVEKGEGPNHVVLIHGFRGNTFTWRHLIDSLANAGFHVWAIDFLGYGFSDKPPIQYGLDLFTEQIKAFMDDKGIDQAHLIGNSMGGGIILFTALSHPERVNSLTLISALGYPLDIPLYISIGKHFSDLWTPFLSPGMIRKGIEDMVYNKKIVTDEQVLAYALPYRFPGGAEAALCTMRSFSNQRMIKAHPRYSKEIICPLLIIWGDHDTVIPLEHYDHFCRDFPNAHKLLLRNCGHLPQEEKPEDVEKAVITFLSSMKQ